MDTGNSAPGTRPANPLDSRGDAPAQTPDGTDRRTRRWYSASTDTPVLPHGWACHRNIEAGYYLLCRPTAHGYGQGVKHVVDDFGTLAELPPELDYARWLTWTSSEDYEPAGTAWWEQQLAQSRALAVREGAARATRALLQPQTVTLDVAPDDYPQHAASIHIGADARMRDAASHTPSYRISCDHETLVLTHAQLAGLLAAAQALIAGTKRPRGARVQ